MPHMMLSGLLVAAVSDLPIATFDGAKATTWSWNPVNDPVMGGQSVSTFHVDAQHAVGVWQGEVKVVPFLHAPGFCNLQSPGLYKTAEFPDVSGRTGLKVRFSATGLTSYNVMLGSKGARKEKKTGQYAASINGTSDLQDHYVPWSAFKCTYRGQAVDWCPELSTQLAEIESISMGTAFPGKAGTFSVQLASISAGNSAGVEAVGAPTATAGSLLLATFDGKNHKWHTEDDPIMGGMSHATFSPATGDYAGTCAIVPKLGAPGFTILMTESPLMSHFPDVSSYDGLTVAGANLGGNVSSFKLAFCDSHLNFYRCQFGSFKADFSFPSGAKEVFVPWSAFSDKWDPSTGKHKSEDPPAPASLKSLTQLQVWVEGVEGDFHLRLDSVSATKKAAVFV